MYETMTTVVGTLITLPNRRRLPDGTSVVSFRVAANERRFDRAQESWTDGDRLYVSVTCWRKLAANVHASFVVGDPIMLYGRLHTRDYDDKDGRRHSVIELDATAVGPDLTRSTAVITRTPRSTGSSPTGAVAVAGGAAEGPVEVEEDVWDDVLHGPDTAADTPADAERGSAVEAGVGA